MCAQIRTGHTAEAATKSDLRRRTDSWLRDRMTFEHRRQASIRQRTKLITTESSKLRRTIAAKATYSCVAQRRDHAGTVRACEHDDVSTIDQRLHATIRPRRELRHGVSLLLSSRLLDVDRRQLEDGCSQAQTLNQATLLESISIPIPPLPEQQRIVGILDEAFEGIATAKANAEKNLQNARALFESHLQSVLHAEKGGCRRFGEESLTGKLDANAAVEDGQYPFFTCSTKDLLPSTTIAFDCEAILLAGNNAVGDFNVEAL